MSGKSPWNFAGLKAVFDQYAQKYPTEIDSIYKAHPEIMGMGVDVDKRTGGPFLKVILPCEVKGPGIFKMAVYKFKKKPKDIPEKLGDLPIKVEYRGAAKFL